MKRAVGYCVNPECEDYAKGMFLLNHEREYICQRCKTVGKIEEERGQGERNSGPWREVRVEFDYDAMADKYKGIAVVTDNSLSFEANIYTLFSPLIRTERRAMRVAEGLLANLQGVSEIEAGHVPRTTEKLVHFDSSLEEVKRELSTISKSWDGLKAN